MMNHTLSVVPNVVQQHVEESAHLRSVRSVQVRAPHVNLHHLQRLDERIAAHLDGIAVAGEYGAAACMSMLDNPHKGHVFTAAVRAIEDGNGQRLKALLALAEAMPELRSGLASAAGWVSGRFLQGTIRDLLGASGAFHRWFALSACAMHRVDPGGELENAVFDRDEQLRSRGLRCIGESGRLNLLDACIQGIDDRSAACRLWAARSAVLLGERNRALIALNELALQVAGARAYALPILLKVLAPAQGNAVLKRLAQDPLNIRLVCNGCGMSGDSTYVPWLIKQMDDLKLARLAGEAFSMITGLDLSLLDFERKPPAAHDFGPSDNPDDDIVAMDEDDGLPWPDPLKISEWWEEYQAHFTPGIRYFMGEPVSMAHLKKVLREGYQRQRSAAAEYLCLYQPGTPLFPTCAPSWRQERWLKEIQL